MKNSTSKPAISLETIRDFFPITREKVYLFNGNIIPCATPVYEAIGTFLKKWQMEGDACWEMGHAAFTKAKMLFGKLINAHTDTIAGIGNTTTGINMAALMIKPVPALYSSSTFLLIKRLKCTYSIGFF